MPEPFHGVLPALITPFTDDGDAIDAQALYAVGIEIHARAS